MRPKIPAMISFKAKVRNLHNADDSTEPYIEYKRKVDRGDCNLKPHLHDYYNSDLFPSMLNGAYQNAIERKEWVRLSALPKNVNVDTKGFLAMVTVLIEV